MDYSENYQMFYHWVEGRGSRLPVQATKVQGAMHSEDGMCWVMVAAVALIVVAL